MARTARKIDPRNLKLFAELKGDLQYWNVDWVAQEAGVATSTIYFWLEGRTMYPRLDTITKVARAIGYDIQLVKLPERPKAKLKIVK